jgi:hypothetical protein
MRESRISEGGGNAMSIITRSAFAVLIAGALVGVAAAQPAPPPPAPEMPPPAPQMPPPPTIPTAASIGASPSTTSMAAMGSPTSTTATATPDAAPKEPKAGDFDAGGQMRLPSGPDEQGKFATWNWVAVDLKGKYYIFEWLTVTGNAPLAVKKPDMLMGGADPRMIGGLTARLDAKLPYIEKFPGVKKGTEVSLMLQLGYMREGAMLLSEKDYPAFFGSFEPGLATGLAIKLKLSSVVDFATQPAIVYQRGDGDTLKAVQLPISLVLALGSLVKTSADVGIYTGDKFSFSGDNGGRIALGGSLTVKLGPILAHAGAGVASLLTGGLYPTIKDSVYIDLNVKYAK